MLVRILIFTGACFQALTAPLLYSLTDNQPSLCFESQCFILEIADTIETRKTGLMHRETLEPRKGMLFIFEKEGKYPIWMKNMNFSLDILWLDKELKVVHIEENVPACSQMPCKSIFPSQPASYVLETPSGTVKELSLQTGARADLTFAAEIS